MFATCSCACAGPLTAVINAQAQAALSTVAFINAVGFDENRKPINVAFSYNVTNITTGQVYENSITVPFLTIVPIPFIRVSAAVSLLAKFCGAVYFNWLAFRLHWLRLSSMRRSPA